MCGWAVELNMNSFISARQKDTPNTDEAQAHGHARSNRHTQTHMYFPFHLLLPLPCQRLSQRLFQGNIVHPEGYAPTFVSCKMPGIGRVNPIKPSFSTLFLC